MTALGVFKVRAGVGLNNILFIHRNHKLNKQAQQLNTGNTKAVCAGVDAYGFTRRLLTGVACGFA